MVRQLLLLIDDDPLTLKLLNRLVQAAGFRAICCSSAEEGISWLKSCTELPDGILTDIGMENIDGITLAIYLKESKRFRNIPIVMVTARADKDMKEASEEIGCIGYILKPINVSTFGESLNRILKRNGKIRRKSDPGSLSGSDTFWLIPPSSEDSS